MKTVDRFLLRGFLAKTGLMVFLLAGIYVLSEALQQSRKLGEGEFTIAVLGQYLAMRIPGILAEMAPFGVLLGTLVLLGELSRHAELTALRAGGLSLVRIARPLVIGGLVVAAATFVLDDRMAGRLDAMGHSLIDEKLGKAQSGRWLGQGGVWFRDGAFVVSASRVGRSGREMRGVHVYRVADSGLLESVMAARRLVFEDGEWRLHQAVEVSMGDLAGEPVATAPPLKVRPETMADLGRSPERMGFLRLWRYVDQLQRQGQPADYLTFTLWQKITLPLACAVMVLVATPFVSVSTRSGGRVARLLGGIVAGMAFHASNVLVEQLTVAGGLPPVAAAWLPLLVFSGLGGTLLFRMR